MTAWSCGSQAFVMSGIAYEFGIGHVSRRLCLVGLSEDSHACALYRLNLHTATLHAVSRHARVQHSRKSADWFNSVSQKMIAKLG